jgi:hypothetical protein
LSPLTIDLQSAVKKAAEAVDPAALSREQEHNFHSFDEIRNLPSSDRDALFDMLRRAHQGDRSVLETVIDFAYEERPVPIDEFVLGAKYLNLKGQLPRQKIELLAMLDHPSVRHAFIAAGSGSGKSLIVSILSARFVYQLLCLRRPDLYYLLAPGSGIALLNMSVSKDQAKDVVYAEIKGRMEHSPWFKRLKYNAYKYHATFPKKVAVFCSSKNPTVAYGYNTFSASLDEAAFMLSTEEKSLAEDLAEAVLKSMNSRFPGAYKFFAISTLRATDDFMVREIERIKDNGVRIK